MEPEVNSGCFGQLFKPLLHQWNISRKIKPGKPVERFSGTNVGELINDTTDHCHIIPHGPCADDICFSDCPPAYSINKFQVDDVNPSWIDNKFIETIEQKLDELDPKLRELSLKLHDHPELAFKEKYAHDLLSGFMEENNFHVTRHYARLDTAWRAEYSVGRGGKVLGINSEMDALPAIGHGCGHNLIAICGVGIAIAVKTALVKHNLPGRVILLGTPAEEGGGGKIILLNRGVYKEMDICVMSHPAPGQPHSSRAVATNAAQFMIIEYTGKTAHAAASPWEGKNALDAAVIAYSSISALRQQLKPEIRVHGIIEGKNWAANIIPDNARLTYIVRCPSKDDLPELVERIVGCFQGAAASTGCSVKIQKMPAYYDLFQNSVLAREYYNNIARYGMKVGDVIGRAASTDFGNVTYALPALHPAYAIPTVPKGGNHTIEFARSARTKEAHIETMNVTKGLALTGFRAISDPDFLHEVKTAFNMKNASEQGFSNIDSSFVCN